MKTVRVAIWGFGAMGSGVARALLGKKGVEITGVCDLAPQRVGKSIFQLLDAPRRENEPEVLVCKDVEKVVYPGAAEIVVIATDSFTRAVYPKIRFAVERGLNVITSAEEMSWPAAKEPELARKIDRLAREHRVSVLGTGINPGLMMDLLAVCLSGCMTEVRSVECRRVNSLSPFGPAVMEEQGVGLTVEQFRQGAEDGTLAGHVGFAESVGMIASALGWHVEKFTQQMEPILTTVERVSPYGRAEAGNVAGVNMTGQAVVDGKVRINMIHPQQIEPELGGIHTGDYIDLAGTPPVHMEIRPEVDGGVGTIAMIVNMIPHVINARPGLKTMLDLPVPRAVMGNMADMIEED